MASEDELGRRNSSPRQTTQSTTLADNPYNPNSAAYLAYPVKHVVSSLYRRMTEPPEHPVNKLLDAPNVRSSSGAYTPPKRAQSPFQPPPLTPLELRHTLPTRAADSLLLTRSLAEEIRLLIPPRLQLIDNWRLAYSLEAHGASLSTLYEHCANVSTYTQRSGYVLVVRDGSTAAGQGSVFGAYLSDSPKPSLHYFGTGECFLWRASILPTLKDLSLSLGNRANSPSHSQDLLELAGLPPPPSADTTNLQRATTIRGERRTSSVSKSTSQLDVSTEKQALAPAHPPRSGTSTPDRIRFKAFPYSGINDFLIYCESGYLSIGGGDGHYGLWLDDALDNGVSETCPTFGNEPLSDEGRRFEVIGVEVWYVGA
ncbi:oxidation resistance protein 1 [Elasticomyces elasticus]|uniref:Oxidation resistance protein 1 n=1 Tax=Exophiala sideris TaxID=1016849 RepID=A0ABR0JQN6_9EURO|nr:oxidation resistance protein 1 [Elasticomyces elasticus]KAK5039892.1 oxidation resistance protein 1 [Exophiala sideris]KAK5041444.1 oxidation resistance protein 1 [Exophiala sideris]KAK5068271.1 oxidation resistance protein 1 [Exophiala sideris]KAK5187572.1 oxidation resistance protein 1 [Eurotiomycetes sp. CCFEE 6388]